MDEFQKRYECHQERKKQSLEKFDGLDKTKYTLLEQTTFKEIMMNRRSQRIFNDTPILKDDMFWIYKSIQTSPSSCNRQAIYIKEAEPKDIEFYLVGGKNWIDKADRVLLLFANKDAYKSPNEKDFMHWLDAGFVGQNIYLMAEALGIGSCFVNPNIREENKVSFNQKYNQEENHFCGAVALGGYDKKSKTPPLRELKEIKK